MCGIAGILQFDHASRVKTGLLERMTALLAHRGPDDSGHIVKDNAALGHRRLSIIDLTPSGHQPMSNDDGSIWITYNGECYNYQELARGLRAAGVRFRSTSDTEVLLRLYEARGERFLEDVQGMFALAIWDTRRRQMILARDRIGIKPLYYYADARHLAFASEMKALLADPDLPVRLNTSALSDYFHLLSIPDPDSILDGVRKLKPGHYLKATAAGIEERCYWQLPLALNERMKFDEACAQFEGRFGAAVRSHMIADVPVGAFLSGGVDSSSIVCAASAASTTPLETFSITFPGLDQFDESRFAAQAAAHCSSRHQEFALTPDLIEALPRIAWHADEPFAISSAFALYYIAKLARERVKVVLSGDGGDELFAGYVWRHADFSPLVPAHASRARRVAARLLNSAPLRPWLPAALRCQGAGGRDTRYLQSFSCYQPEELGGLLAAPYAEQVAQAWEANITQRYLDGAPGNEQLARKLYTDVKTTLVSEMLTKVDRMTMAHGLEARVPFLDHRLVEWAFTVPGRHKLRGTEGKRLVKKAMEKHLPREILYRPKQGFNVPLKLWLRAELKDFVRDNLAPDRIARRGMLNPAYVSALLDAHFEGRKDASNHIFALLMLELWLQLFMDRRSEFVAA
jgi:asparagine synthase (glutamine-hydrolysing)